MIESQQIDDLFAEWDKLDVPGCALGIMKEGSLIYAKGYGSANLEYDIPNSASSVFRIGSVSKQFTAACIVILAEQEKLSLDDRLKSFFPNFPDYTEKITIRHLLHHTSGIRDYLLIAYLKGLGNDYFYLDADIMKWLINQHNLNFEPGEEFLYSNSGYWLLGQIVNKVAGKNMADFAREEIFKPLGMRNTHFHNDHREIVRNRASGYVPNGDEGYRISMTTLDMIGDGGIFTTIHDIKKWDDAYYNSNVLGKAFWKEMTQPGVLNNGKVLNYACGLRIGEYKGLKFMRHGGAFVGYRAEFLRFPEEYISIAIFANRGDAKPSRKVNQVADILLKDKLIETKSKPEEIPQDDVITEEFQLYQLVGVYEAQPGVVARISLVNDTLHVLQIWNNQSYNIVKIHGNTYQIPGNKNLSFTFSDVKEGLTQTISVVDGGKKTTAKRKKEIDISGPDLNDFTGSYYSKELDVTYNLEIENGILKVRIEDKPSTMDCIVSDVDHFVMILGIVKFLRTDSLISGFELDFGRVKNLKFERK